MYLIKFCSIRSLWTEQCIQIIIIHNNDLFISLFTPTLSRIMYLKELEITVKVGFATKQRMFRTQILLDFIDLSNMRMKERETCFSLGSFQTWHLSKTCCTNWHPVQISNPLPMITNPCDFFLHWSDGLGVMPCYVFVTDLVLLVLHLPLLKTCAP